MLNSNFFLLVLIITTCIASYSALNNQQFFDRYKFSIGSILKLKQYDRLLSSSFLHADITHLFFNMYTLYIFAPIVISHFNVSIFLLIYFLSVLGGNLLTLYFHKKETYYSAIGASGGVVGVVFAAIAIYPTIELLVFFVIPLSGWLFGILYLFFSIYGMRTQMGNIGHGAHFGGAAIGLLTAILLNIELFYQNQLYITILFVPIVYLAFKMFQEK
ncbi:MAG: rhomboid family intramembrane serine protease [Solirubrobacteraceae bacterium]